MILIQRSADLAAYVTNCQQSGQRIGFVPTMGALHFGHLSLIREARRKTDVVVCSIFVNPTQFNQASDLASYPRTLGNDIHLLEQERCDVLFHPTVEEVYHGDTSLIPALPLGEFISRLEGEMRPGHFDGVVTVVSKLFQKVQPAEVFFGQKDFQQCMVVEALIKRDFPAIVFNRCATAREADGLAMSSRNMRLTPEQRTQAPAIYETMAGVSKGWNETNWLKALDQGRIRLQQEPFRLEYLEACHPNTLEELATYHPEAVLLAAVWLGETRLIDNMILKSS